jgi:putative nucleotidyltransferase with HDIG domain
VAPALTDQALPVRVTSRAPSQLSRALAVLRRIAPPAAPAPVHYTAPLLGFVGALVVTSTGLAVWLCRPPSDWVTLGLMVAVVFGLSVTTFRANTGIEHVWTATALLHAGLVFVFGPLGALASATAEALGTLVHARNGWFRVSFNVADMFLSDLALWAVYRVLVVPTWGNDPTRYVVGGIAVGVTQWAVNHGLLLGVFVAMRGRAARPVAFIRSAAQFVPYSVAYAFAAFAFPVLFDQHGAIGVSTVIAPIVAAQAFLVMLDRQIRSREEERSRHIADLEDSHRTVEIAHETTLLALTNALDARDRETVGHSRRVVEYSLEMGRVLGLDAADLRILAHGALLHDIGKIGVPDAILHKPAGLTDEEWLVMRQHPEIGARMIEDVDALRETRRIILHHHERWDGTGYPRGLRGTDIVRGARIFTVADSIDAMTQNRPYRAALSFEEALDEVRACRGLQFDPDAVDALFSIPHVRLLEIAAVRKPPRLDLFQSVPCPPPG